MKKNTARKRKATTLNDNGKETPVGSGRSEPIVGEAEEPQKLVEEEVTAESAKTKRHYRLPNLCDPTQGQLFPGFDKYEDWEEFEDIRKDQILNRFR